MNIEIREVKREDSYQLLSLMKQTSTETLFLAKEPEEWNFTLADEYSIIENVLKDKNQKWFVAVDDEKIIALLLSIFIKQERNRPEEEQDISLIEECMDWIAELEHGYI